MKGFIVKCLKIKNVRGLIFLNVLFLCLSHGSEKCSWSASYGEQAV